MDGQDRMEQDRKSDDSLSSPSFLRRLEEAKLTALAEFAAGAGHEINNPLAIISGRAQLLLEKTVSPEDRRHLAVIIAQARRAYEMIADIRLFSRPPEPIPAPIDLRDFFDEMDSDISQTFPERKGKIRILRDEEEKSGETFPVSITADRPMLRSIFDALIRNAAEAVDPGQNVLIQIRGQIRAGEDAKPNRLIFVIEDNGPGIPKQARSEIFSPFYSGRNHGRGLGFGLSRSWAYARKMGGDLYLDPDPPSSGAARFILELPTE